MMGALWYNEVQNLHMEPALFVSDLGGTPFLFAQIMVLERGERSTLIEACES
jgi:hypothetical protein